MGKSGSGGGVGILEERRRLAAAIEAGEFSVIATETEAVQVYDEVEGVVVVKHKSKEYPDFTRAVNKGAALLDKRVPGWFTKIDPSALNLDDKNSCVLGQSWGLYKDLADALGQEIESGGNNFDRLTRSLWGRAVENKNEPAEHGFAFPSEVYYWNHEEARRRIGERKTTKTERKLSWDIDKELWEHLTKTWLVLIEARQKVQAKLEAEELARVKQEITDIAGALRQIPVPDNRLEDFAALLVSKGIALADLHAALTEAELPDDQGWDLEDLPMLTPTVTYTDDDEEDLF